MKVIHFFVFIGPNDQFGNRKHKKKLKQCTMKFMDLNLEVFGKEGEPKLPPEKMLFAPTNYAVVVSETVSCSSASLVSSVEVPDESSTSPKGLFFLSSVALSLIS